MKDKCVQLLLSIETALENAHSANSVSSHSGTKSITGENRRTASTTMIMTLGANNNSNLLR